MDSKKSGLRIRDAVLSYDTQTWSRFTEPYWKRRQLEMEKRPTFVKEHNPKELERVGGGTPILDKLVISGERQVNGELKRLKDRVDTTKDDNELFFIGRGTDMDLAAPWEQAKERAKGKPHYEAEIKAIEEFVKKCFGEMKQLGQDVAKGNCTARQRTNEIRAISSKLADFQPITDPDVPSIFGALDADTIRRRVIASCAYVHDMVHGGPRRGGSMLGVVWQIAMRELCAIKSYAVSKGDTVTIARSVHEKRETHKYWG